MIAAGSPNKDDVIWGHNLVKLGEILAIKQPAFDLSEIILDGYIMRTMPMTSRDGLDMFDPFFSELRYPHELEKLDGVGPSDWMVLDLIIARIVPFTCCADATPPANNPNYPGIPG